MLTVRRLADDAGLELACGTEAADQPLRWVHISELDDPTPWLTGSELLLTTGMGLAEPEAQRAYVDRLADHGLAGLGLGLGFAHDRLPEALVEAASRRGFPLFAVPYELPFIALTERAFGALVNEGYAALRRATAAVERLHGLVLEQRGLDAIAQALASQVGGAVLVLDARGEVLARGTFRRRLEEPGLIAEVREHEPRTFAPVSGDLAGRALALPVHGPVAAWLVAVKDEAAFAEGDRLVLHQAVTVVALDLLRRHVADTTERRLGGEVLTRLLRGELSGADAAARIAAFGLDGDVSALALRPRERVDERAVALALEDALSARGLAGVVGAASGLTWALVGADVAAAQGEELRGAVAASVGRRIRGGAGRAQPPGDARRALLEARCALEARELAQGAAADDDALADHRELGSFQLLLALQGTDELRLFCDALLAPIEEAEGRYGEELLRSLEAFIECHGQWEAAARRLPCHRHTLRYRIRRVEELTGRDLGNARDRIEFWLALRGRELVDVGEVAA